MSFKCIDVEKLYETDDKLKRDDVEILMEWLKKQPHLPEIKEVQIAVFLKRSKYRLEKFKTIIDNYFTMRTHYPDLFVTLTEATLKKVLSTVIINILPKTTPKGHSILLLKLLDYKVDSFNSIDYVRMINMLATLYIHQHGVDNEVVLIFDSKGFTLGHLTRINLNALKYELDYIQGSAPVKINSAHFVNVAPVVNTAITIVKPWIRSKNFNKLRVHHSMDSFYNDVPRECLPEDYGGGLASCKVLQEENLNNILNSFEFLHWHESQKVDEAKRLGKSASSFGVDGTFKKLQID